MTERTTEENLQLLAHIDLAETLLRRMKEREAELEAIDDADEKLVHLSVSRVLSGVLDGSTDVITKLTGLDHEDTPEETVAVAKVIELFDGNRRKARLT